MNASYSIHVVPDETTDGEPCYLASHPELQGCMSHGLTIAEAMTNLHAARELYITTLQELDQPIPPPSGSETVVLWQRFPNATAAPDISPAATRLPTSELIASL